MVLAMANRTAPALLALAALLGGVLGLAPAAPAAAQQQCVKPGGSVKPLPWAPSLLDPGRSWPFATGAGVTVAVVGTGVDAGNPQLHGHVLDGTNVVSSKLGNTD